MKKIQKKGLVLSTETVRALDDATLVGAAGAGDTGASCIPSCFFTVCAPCKTFPCPGSGRPECNV
jgi:hypothetical protein